MGFSLNRGFIISQPCKEGGVCCGTRMFHRSHGSLPSTADTPLKPKLPKSPPMWNFCFLPLPRPVYGRLSHFSALPRPTTLPFFRALLGHLKRLTEGFIFLHIFPPIFVYYFHIFTTKKERFLHLSSFCLNLFDFNYNY